MNNPTSTVRKRKLNDVFITVRIDVNNLKRLKQGILKCDSLELVPVASATRHPNLFGIRTMIQGKFTDL